MSPSRRRLPAWVLFAVALGILLLVRATVAEPFKIPSRSMAPTLLAGDHVLATKVGGGPLQRGELVVFEAPDSGELAVKRVVGLPGEDVAIDDGRLTIGGRPHAEPYADARAIDGVFFGPEPVPAGAVFVMGDDRLDSTDSRDFGPVPESRVIGRVVARLWPPARVSSL